MWWAALVVVLATMFLSACGGSALQGGSDNVLHLRNMDLTEQQYRDGVRLLLVNPLLRGVLCPGIRGLSSEEVWRALQPDTPRAASETPEPEYVGAVYVPGQSPDRESGVIAGGILLEECRRVD